MLTRQQVLYGLERVELRSTSIFDSCPLKSRSGRQEVRPFLVESSPNKLLRHESNVPGLWQECSGFSAMYRTPDGTCNNFQRPSWGSSFMPFLRFLPPDYSDGIEQFRRSG